jgi:uncharacterized membrane protein YagU involved in acid resistance
MRRSFFLSALTAGLIAGALDITAACIHSAVKNGTPPSKVLKYVASGAVDPKTFSNDIMLVVVGLLVHFIIAISFAFFFFFLAKQIPALVKYPVLTGILYGVLVWSAMQFIILPYISRINPKPIVGKEAITNAIIAASIIVVCIGLPIVLLARKYVRTDT